MKKILFILFLTLGALSVQAQEIKWMSLDEALAKQKKVPKPIFVDVCTNWHGPCKLLEATTYRDAEVVDFITKNYYAVKFNAEGNSVVNYHGETFTNPSYDPNRKGRNSAHQLTKYLKVEEYPSMFIIDKKGNVLDPIVGSRTPEQLLKLLR